MPVERREEGLFVALPQITIFALDFPSELQTSPNNPDEFVNTSKRSRLFHWHSLELLGIV